MTRKRKGKKAPPRKFHAISVPAEMVPVVEEVRDNMSERLGVPKLPIATVVAHAISMLHRMHAGDIVTMPRGLYASILQAQVAALQTVLERCSLTGDQARQIVGMVQAEAVVLLDEATATKGEAGVVSPEDLAVATAMREAIHAPDLTEDRRSALECDVEPCEAAKKPRF